MKPFKEKAKHKKKIHYYVFDEITDFIFEGLLGLLCRLVVGIFHLIGRLIIAILQEI